MLIETMPLAALLPLASDFARMWYAAPLIVAVSLSYAATRHEQSDEIIGHAWRFGRSVVFWMVAIFVLLQALTWWV